LSTFVDTSALLALLDADESRHDEAARGWRELLESNEPLVSTSYVLVETFALVQRRLGVEAVRALDQDLVPLLELEWVGEEIHRSAMAGLLLVAKQRLSLVDCVSFETMRRWGLTRAYTFDHHFAEQGFEQIPEARA
jgi:predicted nucleic acid-binding protein